MSHRGRLWSGLAWGSLWRLPPELGPLGRHENEDCRRAALAGLWPIVLPPTGPRIVSRVQDPPTQPFLSYISCKGRPRDLPRIVTPVSRAQPPWCQACLRPFADGSWHKGWLREREISAMNMEKYTERTRGFVQSAQSVAIREGHQQFTPEHILKVLLDDEEGLAAGLIERAGGRPHDAPRDTELALAKLPKVQGAGAGQLYLAPATA